jgi:hypothetical protein
MFFCCGPIKKVPCLRLLNPSMVRFVLRSQDILSCSQTMLPGAKIFCSAGSFLYFLLQIYSQIHSKYKMYSMVTAARSRSIMQSSIHYLQTETACASLYHPLHKMLSSHQLSCAGVWCAQRRSSRWSATADICSQQHDCTQPSCKERYMYRT